MKQSSFSKSLLSEAAFLLGFATGEAYVKASTGCGGEFSLLSLKLESTCKPQKQRVFRLLGFSKTQHSSWAFCWDCLPVFRGVHRCSRPKMSQQGLERGAAKSPLNQGLSGLKWVQGQDLNLGPSGYEPDELPGCSTLQ
jgi:hypothetical protein